MTMSAEEIAEATGNLPEQMHAPRGQEVARAVEAGSGFDLGGQDIRLPRMKLGQSQSPAVIDKLVEFADVFVQRSRDDVEPEVLQSNGKLTRDELSEPLRFYIHAVRRGVNWKEPGHPDAGLNGLVLGPWGVSVLQFIQRNPQVDPTAVYRKYDYTITVPSYPTLPVAFLMASAWGGSAASDLNTSIQLQRSQGVEVSTIPFRLQVKPVRNDKGSFVRAFVGLAKVAEKDQAKDQELVALHAALLPTAVVDAADEADAAENQTPKATDQPSVA